MRPTSRWRRLRPDGRHLAAAGFVALFAATSVYQAGSASEHALLTPHLVFNLGSLASSVGPGPVSNGVNTTVVDAGAVSVASIAHSVDDDIGAPEVAPAATASNPLTLTTSAYPDRICAFGQNGCTADTGTARVTITASADVAPTPYWPNVQVAFVIETTAYDGVYYHYWGYPGTDPCALQDNRMGLPCEESNGVPFFEANAGEVAEAIQEENPHSKVSFAMVDFFGTDCGDWNDCGDSEKYHVDVPEFVPASVFGPAVTETLKDGVFAGGYAGIVGLDDNFLHSPSITALYGAIIGSGLDWSANTHHVIVIMGSTAPRDPNYDEDYYVSAFDPCCAGTQAMGWTCEPSYQFSFDSSPNCEGWVESQNGNPNDSIAGLTRTSPTCTDSIGHTCTIDVIDLLDTATDPYSLGWPKDPAYTSHTQDGPGAPRVIENVDHVLEAGCAMAAATGGSWDGPSYWTCPNGQSGTLTYVPHGPYNAPNTNNPALFQAFRTISFGPIYQTLVANGTKSPMFTYEPVGDIRVAPQPQVQVACETPDGAFPSCQEHPENITAGGIAGLAWNWSTNPDLNALYVGDTWTASFNVIAVGPPWNAPVPVDACTTVACRAVGSGAVDGRFTSVTYRLGGNSTQDNVTIVQSFPVAEVIVLVTPAVPLPAPNPPAPPVAPPGVAIPVAPVVPVVQPIGVGATVGIASVSVQGIAAGLLGAGFIRVSQRNRPIANPVLASKQANVRSKFEAEGMSSSGGVGKFE